MNLSPLSIPTLLSPQLLFIKLLIKIKYAALDAWVSYMVGAKLLVRKPNIAPVNIDLWSHDTLMRYLFSSFHHPLLIRLLFAFLLCN